MFAAQRTAPGRASIQTFKNVKSKALRRKYAQVAASSDAPQPGTSLHGFTLQRTKHVPELELTAMHFQHDKTGAEYLHLAKDDKNNVFSIGFKTNPPDHTGVPHILEHCTLCGSDKYPVRDPFFKMMPRSLNNFMNAMTYPEHTIYPFATTNHQDFKNLMAVYLDSTLHPLLRAHDFAQEGWRIGPEDARAPVSTENKIVFKGVVYNEMKGNMSNADYLFGTRWKDNIFPAIKDSGGDPQKITDLTHEQLTKFHAEHYNPSNAKIFTYGNMPYEEHLKQLGEQLAKFDKSAADTALPVPISLSGNQTVTVLGPSDPTYPKDQQYKASITWLMGDTEDVLQTFSLGIISSLLLDGFSAPLYENTVEIGTGASYSANTGYDPSGKIGMFTVGLNGLKKQDLTQLNHGIKNTLLAVRRRGFDQAKVEGRLHQMELSLKHKSANFGMGMTTRLQDAWFNGVDPFKSVDPEEILSAFKSKIQDPAYLKNLFTEYFLSDDTFTFIMEPSESFGAEVVAEEAARLNSKIEQVTQQHSSPEAANKALEKQETDLLAVQESAEGADVSCLPTVSVGDITRQAERVDLRFSNLGDTKLQWREAPTGGLTYFRAVQSFANLPDELRTYLPLFTAAIQRLGTQSLSIENLEDEIRLRTGGIAVSPHSAASPLDIDIAEDGIVLAGTAFDRNVPHMFNLLRQTIQETDFSKRNVEEKLRELIKGSASSAINDIADAGHAYARRFAEAGLSPQARLVEQTDGLTQTRLMLDLAARPTASGSLSDVVENLRAIQSFLLSDPSRLRVAITCASESSSDNESHLSHFLDSLASSNTTSPPAESAQTAYPRNAKSFFPLPYQVYYTALATRTVPYTHASSAPLSILAEILTHKRLHPEVREKGGAYGASAYQSPLRGLFGFATYRDPSPAASLAVMRGAPAWAAAQQFSQRDVDEAKLSVFQGLDAPRSVSDEGMALFLSGVDADMRQARRERLLDVTPEDVRRVAQEVLVPAVDGGSPVNAAALGEARDGLFSTQDGWTKMSMGPGEGEATLGADAGESGGAYTVL